MNWNYKSGKSVLFTNFFDELPSSPNPHLLTSLYQYPEITTSYNNRWTRIVYVSKSGSDNGDGTEKRPYKTLQNAINQTISNNLQAYVLIIIGSGIYNENITIDDGINWGAGAIMMQGDGDVIIDGRNKITFLTKTDEETPLVSAKIDVVFNNIKFTNWNQLVSLNIEDQVRVIKFYKCSLFDIENISDVKTTFNTTTVSNRLYFIASTLANITQPIHIHSHPYSSNASSNYYYDLSNNTFYNCKLIVISDAKRSKRNIFSDCNIQFINYQDVTTAPDNGNYQLDSCYWNNKYKFGGSLATITEAINGTGFTFSNDLSWIKDTHRISMSRTSNDFNGSTSSEPLFGNTHSYNFGLSSSSTLINYVGVSKTHSFIGSLPNTSISFVDYNEINSDFYTYSNISLFDSPTGDYARLTSTSSFGVITSDVIDLGDYYDINYISPTIFGTQGQYISTIPDRSGITYSVTTQSNSLLMATNSSYYVVSGPIIYDEKTYNTGDIINTLEYFNGVKPFQTQNRSYRSKLYVYGDYVYFATDGGYNAGISSTSYKY